MALKIKLSRGGGRNDAHFSIVVGEARSRRDGQFIEKVGHYHPTVDSADPARIVVDAERIKYWISVGALPTETVAKLVSRKADGLLKEYIPAIKPSKHHGMTKKAVAEKKKEEAKAAEQAKKDKAAAAKKAAEEAAASAAASAAPEAPAQA